MKESQPNITRPKRRINVDLSSKQGEFLDQHSKETQQTIADIMRTVIELAIEIDKMDKDQTLGVFTKNPVRVLRELVVIPS
jgi:hypothetical protein